MDAFLAACVALIALELGILIAGVLVALSRLQRTAKAVEVLAYRLDQKVDDVGAALKSTWLRSVGAMLAGFLGNRKRS